MDPIDLVAEVAPTAVAGAVGVWLGASLQDRRRRRIEAVDRVVPALEDVLRLVRFAPTQADPQEWIKVAAEALNAAEAVLPSLPRRWRHLRHSVQGAIGEFTGVPGFGNRLPPGSDVELLPYCSLWADNAESYLTYSMSTLRAWKYGGLVLARRPRYRSFDEWLRYTGRSEEHCGCHQSHTATQGTACGCRVQALTASDVRGIKLTRH